MSSRQKVFHASGSYFRPKLQPLEDRRLLAGDVSMAGDALRLDVSGDGNVSAMDALQVINGLQRGESPIEHDVNGDHQVTALDALQIINSLNVAATSARLASAEAVEVVPPYRPARIDDIAMQGFAASIHAGDSLNSAAILHRVDPTIRFDFGSGGPDPALSFPDHEGTTSPAFAITWSGAFTADFSGDATLFADVGVGDQVRLTVDGVTVFDTITPPLDGSPDGDSSPETTASVQMLDGQAIELVVDYIAGPDDSHIVLGIDSPFTFRTALPSHQVSPTAEPSGMIQGVQYGALLESFQLPGEITLDEFRSSAELLQNQPVSSETIPQTSTILADQTGNATRTRGFVSPRLSGLHRFHVAASGPAQFWLSSGADAGSARMIAQTEDGTVIPGDFADPSAAVSDPVYLLAGQTYFIESLAVVGSPSELVQRHVTLGWTEPADPELNAGDTSPIVPALLGPTPIDASVIRPVLPVVSLHADVSQTHEASDFAAGTRTVVHRSDALGTDLLVRYTVAGVAENGIDYALLSGLVVIPAGQTSAIIDVDPVDDGLPEGAESVVIRLVGNDQYQLGPESSRQVVNTIAGELESVSEERLPDGALTLAVLGGDVESSGILNLGNGATAIEVSVADPPPPQAGGGQDVDVLQVDVPTVGNPWEVAMGYKFDDSVITEGQQLLASVWARSVAPNETVDASPGSVTIRLQEPMNFAGIERTWQVGDEWKLLVLPIEVELGGSAADREFEIRLGDTVQTIQLSGFSLLSVDTADAFERLPREIYSYEGRRFDSAWRSVAASDIAARRELIERTELTVVDASGNPVDGVVVTAMPFDSLLPIGTAVEPLLVVPALDDPSPSSVDAIRYQNLLGQYFDSFTDEYGVQRSAWEIERTRPTRLVELAAELGLPYRGHSVVWGEIDQFPAPADLLSGYQAVLNADGEVAAAAWLKNSILDYIGSVDGDQVIGAAEALAGERTDGAPLVTWWDVINHPIWSREIWDIVGDDFMLEVIDATRAVVHPETRLAINEFAILSNLVDGQGDAFFNLLTYLDQQSTTGRADFDSIGFQSHFDSDRLPAIDGVMAQLERFESLGRDLHVTEFDVDSVDVDEQTQADFTRDFIQALRANEAVTTATLWGFWQGDHWRSDESAGLFEPDWTARPNGQWWLDDRVAMMRAMSFPIVDGESVQVPRASQIAIATPAGDLQIPAGPGFGNLRVVTNGWNNEGGVVSQESSATRHGEGFLMYSTESIETRFPSVTDRAVDHFVLVIFRDDQWWFDNNVEYVPFEPAESDRIVAQVNLKNRDVQLFQGLHQNYAGVQLGYVQGDLTITPNDWNGNEEFGEFGVSVSHLVFDDDPPTETWPGQIRGGLAVQEAKATRIGEAFVLLTQEIVDTRFESVTDRAVDHFVVVVYREDQWFFDNNSEYVPLDPRPTDRLVARIDLKTRDVELFQGLNQIYGGIDLGYADGDLAIIPNQWNGAENFGEFDVSVTRLVLPANSPTQTWIGSTKGGVVAQEKAATRVGDAYLLYSAEAVDTRFPSVTRRAVDHFVLVVYRDDQWVVDDNQDYVPFDPRATDRLVAAIDLESRSVELMQSISGSFAGIDLGYIDGDLVITPNQWNGVENFGEFGVSGSVLVFSSPT